MIRILHTADWHLGREFHGRELGSLHEQFFDWLLAEVESREIDLVLMAGDIFDRALPPVDAIELFNRRLAELSELAPVVLITGNHDSVVRMGHGALLKSSIHLRCGIARLGEPVLIETGGFPLAVYPIPYLDPPTMHETLALEQASHHAIMEEAVRRSLEDLATRPDTRAVAVGHAFITGAETSDSERSIQVGGSESVPVSVFDGFDYVALGHLHRPQQLDGGRVRYSGSPIPLSFSEVGPGTAKSVTVVELTAEGRIETEAVELPEWVKIARIRGTLEELLNDPELADLEEEAWLEVTVTDDVRPDQPREILRSRFKGLVIPRFTAPLLVQGETPDAAEIEHLDPLELVDRFIEYVRGEGHGLDPDESKLIRRAFEDHGQADSRS